MRPHRLSVRPGSAAALLLAALGITLPAAAQPVIDGMSIPDEFGAPLATQRFDTSFGDHEADSQFGSGSELDALYVTSDAQFLYVGLTGNLENNGNALVLFIDVDGGASGAPTLFTRDIFGSLDPLPGLPRYLAGDPGGEPGLNELTFDAGFAPNFVLGFSGGSPLGSQTRSYYLANWTTLADSVGGITPDGLAHTNQVLGLTVAGQAGLFGPPEGTLHDVWPGSMDLGIRFGADNRNTAGVAPGTQVTAQDPAAVAQGFEIAIPLELLGVGPGETVCLLALICGPAGFISNQLLPTDDSAAMLDHLQWPPFDLAFLSGDQFACYTLPAAGCPDPLGLGCEGDTDGDCTVGPADLGLLLGAWNAMTGDPGYIPAADIDGDGVIGPADLGALLSSWAEDCN